MKSAGRDSVPSHGRMHALDGLRGTMMLLGLVLHTVASYTVADFGWYYKDSATTPIADLAGAFIHVFRMPIFFALAGFFAAMLYLRHGARGLLANRLQRIGIPLAVGLVVLFPLVSSGFAFAHAARDSSIAEAWRAVVSIAATTEFYVPTSTMHLWFLYDLLYFYVAALLLAAGVARVPQAWRVFAAAAFRKLLKRPMLRVLILALVTAATLLPMDGVLDTQFSLVPDLAALIAYGVFFGFGWLLYRHHDLLRGFERFAWTQTIAAGLFYLTARRYVLPAVYVIYGSWWGTMFSIVNGIVVWMLFFGLTGLFLRYLDRPSAWARYVVDASYWLYLVHLPCIAWVTALLAGSDLSVWVKMLVVCSTAMVIGFVTYDWLVRPSLIGAVLNGRRYPRGLPSVAATDLREATPPAP